jgi:hypothetical protein
MVSAFGERSHIDRARSPPVALHVRRGARQKAIEQAIGQTVEALPDLIGLLWSGWLAWLRDGPRRCRARLRQIRLGRRGRHTMGTLHVHGCDRDRDGCGKSAGDRRDTVGTRW